MLAEWERGHPGRVQSIFSALRNVEPETLADTGWSISRRCARARLPSHMPMPTTPSQRRSDRDSMRRPLPNSYWVVPGKLLAGEYPCGEAPEATRARIRLMLRAGIDSFLDLTQLGERPEYRSLLPARVHYLRSAIVDTRFRPTRPDAGHPGASARHARRWPAVYVHCRAGIGRTGTVIAAIWPSRGWTAPRRCGS